MATRKAGKKGASKKGASKKGGARKGTKGGAAAGHVSGRNFGSGKAARKGARKAGGAAAGHVSGIIIRGRAANTSQLLNAIIRRREWVMYAQPMRDLVAVGNIAEMRRVSEATRNHLEDVQSSLARLDQAIRGR